MRCEAKLVIWCAVTFTTVGVAAGIAGTMARTPDRVATVRVDVPVVDATAREADERRIDELESQNATLTEQLAAQAHRRRTEDTLGLRVTGAAEAFTNFDGPFLFRGDAVDRTRFLALLPVLLDELDRYPAELIGQVGLHRIIVCGDLREWAQGEGGVAVFASGTIYLTADNFEGDRSWFRHTVHHELFHFIDQAAGTFRAADPAWAACNPAGFAYAAAGSAVSAENASSGWAADLPAFLTTYSRSGIEEDKAEVYGWLMAEPAAVRRRAADDAGVRGKAERVRRIVTRFDTGMDGIVPRT